MNKVELEELLKTEFNITNDVTISNLYIYYELLVESSKVMNLTTITDLDGVYIKHFYDSLLLSKTINLNNNITLADIGTGAGFPGLVLKIVYPNLQVTLIEPTTKRCNFLQKVIDKLELKNILVINERAENLNESYREYYDIVTARAVSSLNILSELCVPFVKKEGYFIPLKGSSYQEEILNSKSACLKLKIKLIKEYRFKLPFEMGERAILLYKKLEATSKTYPRIYAKIKKTPL